MFGWWRISAEDTSFFTRQASKSYAPSPVTKDTEVTDEVLSRWVPHGKREAIHACTRVSLSRCESTGYVLCCSDSFLGSATSGEQQLRRPCSKDGLVPPLPGGGGGGGRGWLAVSGRVHAGATVGRDLSNQPRLIIPGRCQRNSLADQVLRLIRFIRFTTT